MDAATIQRQIEETLRRWGFGDLAADPPHNWRCIYNKDYGREDCTHDSDFVQDLVLAATTKWETINGNNP
jgi:hypothetical protein